MEVYTFKVHRQAPWRRVDWEDCGLCKVNFQSPSDFREYTLFCVYIETAWYRESLQHRKAFVKLLPVFSPTLLQFCLSLYSHPLILTFTTHNSRCGPWGYHVPLQSSGGCVGSPTSFFFSDVFLHSGVTLFHSPTQGITSPRGAAVDLVGRCARSIVRVTWHKAAVSSQNWQVETPPVPRGVLIPAHQTPSVSALLI